MAKVLVLALLVWLRFAALCAAYMQYTFTSNGTCPGSGRPWICDPVEEVICGEETSRAWAYCCPVAYDYCSTGPTTCSGSDGLAGDGQIDCEAYGTKWCCSEEYETCTQRANQTNVCLYDADNNPYVEFDPELASKVWTSVLSASPTATFSGDDIAVLVEEASASASPSQTSLSGSASPSSGLPTPTAPSASPSPMNSSHGLSGGAIAGIVVGVVALLGIIVGALLLWRKRRVSAAHAQAGAYQPAPSSAGYTGHFYEGDRKEAATEVSAPHELASYERRVELGSNDEGPHEMPAR